MGLNPHSPSEAAQFNMIVNGMKTSFTPFTTFIVIYNALFGVKNDDIGPKNTFLRDVNID